MLLLLCAQYSRLSKQYGMEIYLKKEHLHYTGSVKERGVLYLLTSLTQVIRSFSSCLSGHSWCDLLSVCSCRLTCVTWPFLTFRDKNSPALVDSGFKISPACLWASEADFSQITERTKTKFNHCEQRYNIFLRFFLWILRCKGTVHLKIKTYWA